MRKTRRWVLPVAALLLATGSSSAAATGPAVAAGPIERPGRPVEALAAPPDPTAPFPTCPNYGYMVTLPEGSGRSTFNRYDIGTATLIPIKQFDFVVNAIGYSKTQNVFWGLHSVDNGPDAIVRFDKDGNLVEVGVPQDASGTPLAEFEALAGTVDGDELIVHTRTPANHVVTIDVDPDSTTFGEVTGDVAVSRATGALDYLNVGDWDVYDQDGLLYAIELSSAFRKVVTIDPASGAVTELADLSDDLPNSDNYGGAFVEDGSGNLYVGANNIISGGSKTGRSQTFMIRTAFSPPLVTAYAKGGALRVNDGGDCLLATDFGDAPDTYGTMDSSGGPAHVLSSYLHKGKKLSIGAENDADLDGFHNDDATTDDGTIAQVNDEDGVPVGTKSTSNAPSLTVTSTNTTGLKATLAGWLDSDRDGAFGAGERATVALAASATSAKLTWPGFSMDTGEAKSFLRLRLYEGAAEDDGPQPGGWVDGGEVEDHQVTLVKVTPRVIKPVTAPVVIIAPEEWPDEVWPPRDVDDDGDIDQTDADLALDALPATGTSFRPYLLLGVGMVLLGLVVLGLALVIGPKKVRRRLE
ncbi:MAG: hypothetical protein HOV79_07750 [Hamadaea sp.]|nr:hypothetical protein [Hamadaea sp.]